MNLQPVVVSDLYYGPLSALEFEEHNIETPNMNTQNNGEDIGNSLPHLLGVIVSQFKIKTQIEA